MIDYRRHGEVTFTAIWLEQNIRESTPTVTVATAPTNYDYEIFVTPIDEICFEFTETLTYYMTFGGVRNDEIPICFRIDNPNNLSSAQKGNHTIEVNVDSSNLLGKEFELVAYNDEYETENRQTIKVTSLF